MGVFCLCVGTETFPFQKLRADVLGNNEGHVVKAQVGGHRATRSDSFPSGPFDVGVAAQYSVREQGILILICARCSQLPGCCQGNGRSCLPGWPSRGGYSPHCSLRSSCDLEKVASSSTALQEHGFQVNPLFGFQEARFVGLQGTREGCTRHSAKSISWLCPHPLGLAR